MAVVSMTEGSEVLQFNRERSLRTSHHRPKLIDVSLPHPVELLPLPCPTPPTRPRGPSPPPTPNITPPTPIARSKGHPHPLRSSPPLDLFEPPKAHISHYTPPLDLVEPPTRFTHVLHSLPPSTSAQAQSSKPPHFPHYANLPSHPLPTHPTSRFSTSSPLLTTLTTFTSNLTNLNPFPHPAHGHITPPTTTTATVNTPTKSLAYLLTHLQQLDHQILTQNGVPYNRTAWYEDIEAQIYSSATTSTTHNPKEEQSVPSEYCCFFDKQGQRVQRRRCEGDCLPSRMERVLKARKRERERGREERRWWWAKRREGWKVWWESGSQGGALSRWWVVWYLGWVMVGIVVVAFLVALAVAGL